jgi:hypothetical protein
MTQQTLMPVVVMNMNMQLLRSAQWWQSSSAWAGCQLQLSRTTFKDSMTGNPSAPPAFVFDIDGVLVRGQKAIPSAVQAIKQVNVQQLRTIRCVPSCCNNQPLPTFKPCPLSHQLLYI